MAIVIFEQVSVAQTLIEHGNKVEVYRFWDTKYGKIGRFRASESIGYGENMKYQSYNFFAEGKVAEKLLNMKLKVGSKLFVTGELVFEIFEKDEKKINRLVVKVLDVRFAAGSTKLHVNEKKEEEKRETKNIPLPRKVERKTEIPVPVMEKSVEKENLQDEDEILNLDTKNLFSAGSFMGVD